MYSHTNLSSSNTNLKLALPVTGESYYTVLPSKFLWGPTIEGP